MILSGPCQLHGPVFRLQRKRVLSVFKHVFFKKHESAYSKFIKHKKSSAVQRRWELPGSCLPFSCRSLLPHAFPRAPPCELDFPNPASTPWTGYSPLSVLGLACRCSDASPSMEMDEQGLWVGARGTVAHYDSTTNGAESMLVSVLVDC